MRRLVAAAVLVGVSLAGVAGGGDVIVYIPVLEVPLTIHIVRRSNGTGGISQAQVDQAIVDANLAFERMAMSFCQFGPTLYLDDDFYYFDLETTDDYAAIRAIDVVPDTVNIYFTENMGCPLENQNDCPNPAICGLSSYPGYTLQGIVVRNACIGVPLDRSTIAHELGHYFYLYHTQDHAGGYECPDGDNCALAGDHICDTPASPRLDIGNVDEDTCAYTGNESVCGDPYEPDPRNHMSYAPKPCRDRFSLQQAARARSMLINERPELILDPGCPVAGACTRGTGSCTMAHDTPGCSDGSCCETVCANDLFCCAAEWDADCAWEASFACLDIAIPPWLQPEHGPLGLANLAVNPSGQLVISGLGPSGLDGAVADLGVMTSFDIQWVNVDPGAVLPPGAFMKLSALGWTGLPRPKPAGECKATKVNSAMVSIAANLQAATVQIYNGSVLVAQAMIAPGNGVFATAPVMPVGGGIPPIHHGAVARFWWNWAAPVAIQVPGGPAASGNRVEIHQDGGMRVEHFAKLGLQAAMISQIAIVGETLGFPAGPLNDECQDPALVGEESVPFTVLGGASAWYLAVATCSGPASVATCSSGSVAASVTVYTGTCDQLQVVGSDFGAGCGSPAPRVDFQAECGVAYLVKIASAATISGTLSVSCDGFCPSPCPADLDGDSVVGIVDFLALLGAWGPNPGHPADIDGDGNVGILDLLALLSTWGSCPDVVD